MACFEMGQPFIVEGQDSPQAGKATWQMTEFWEGVLRKHAALPPGDVLDALTMDATVGQLPMKWLKHRWPAMYRGVNRNLMANKDRIREMFGDNAVASIMWYHEARMDEGVTAADDEQDDWELYRDAGDFEERALHERLRASEYLPVEATEAGEEVRTDRPVASGHSGASGSGSNAAAVTQPPGGVGAEAGSESEGRHVERSRHRMKPY